MKICYLNICAIIVVHREERGIAFVLVDHALERFMLDAVVVALIQIIQTGLHLTGILLRSLLCVIKTRQAVCQLG